MNWEGEIGLLEMPVTNIVLELRSTEIVLTLSIADKSYAWRPNCAVLSVDATGMPRRGIKLMCLERKICWSSQDLVFR